MTMIEALAQLHAAGWTKDEIMRAAQIAQAQAQPMVQQTAQPMVQPMVQQTAQPMVQQTAQPMVQPMVQPWQMSRGEQPPTPGVDDFLASIINPDGAKGG